MKDHTTHNPGPARAALDPATLRWVAEHLQRNADTNAANAKLAHANGDPREEVLMYRAMYAVLAGEAKVLAAIATVKDRRAARQGATHD